MLSSRQHQISDFIQLRSEVSNAELKALCGGVSDMTLWRDLKKLEEAGLIRRVRGGAHALTPTSPGVFAGSEDVYSKRAGENISAKQAIARAALPLITPGRAIFLDAGSTLMTLAQILPDNGYTILTIGLNIAIEVAKRTSCTVICAGGAVDPHTLACFGAETDLFLDNLNIDLFLMACSSYTPSSGLTSGSRVYSTLRRKVLEKSAQTVLLMDHSKIGRRLPYSFAGFADIDQLITDAPLPPDAAADAQQHGVEVIVASGASL